MADIQTQEQARSNAVQAQIDAEQEKEKQEKDEQAYLSKQKTLAGKILPIFDYTVSELNAMLTQIAIQAQMKIYSDFPSTIPTIYSSSMVSNGIIVDGTNFISIGTNSAWHFQISTVVTPEISEGFNGPAPGPYHAYSDEQRRRYIVLNITSEGTNGESSISVKPNIVWMGRVLRPILPRQINGFHVTVSVPNGLNLDLNSGLTNYAPINAALNRIVGAQDQQSPLSLK